MLHLVRYSHRYIKRAASHAFFYFSQRGRTPPWLKKRRIKTRFSLISGAYNTARYIDAFIGSVVAQTVPFQQIELIIVDDGSTDNLVERVRHWQDRYPSIKYIRLEKAGVSAARNAGLAIASGDWVSFPDSDDILHPRYLERVADAISRNEDLAMVSCNTIPFLEEPLRIRDNHGLRHQFKFSTVQPIPLPQNFMQMSSSTAFFDRNRLEELQLKFSERITMTFEDAHLVNRYLIRSFGFSAAFLHDARYFYRKRSDQSSAMNGRHRSRDFYINHTVEGWVDLVRDCQGQHGRVPLFVQRALARDLAGHLTRAIGDPFALTLSDQERRTFLNAVAFVLQNMDNQLLDSSAFSTKTRMVAYSIKGTKAAPQVLSVSNFDADANMIELSVDLPTDGPSIAVHDGLDIVTPSYCKQVSISVAGVPMARQDRLWIPTCQTIRASYEGQTVRVRSISGEMFDDAVSPRLLTSRGLPKPSARPLIDRAKSAGAKYQDAWILMDRSTDAGDNGEQLYRWIKRNHPQTPCFFAIDRTAADWNRLEEDGFALIDFKSDEMMIALLRCRCLISSHGDRHIRNRVNRSTYGDAFKAKFVFLQHGTIKDDLSGWINAINPDLMLTSSPAEYESIVKLGSPYILSEKQVKLTGLPRHDILCNNALSSETVFIMPTWRKQLMAEVGSDVEKFRRTQYATAWREFLNSPELQHLSQQKRIVFCPHQNVAAVAEGLSPPIFAETIDIRIVGSLAPHIAKAACLVTDYSSIAFDAAILNKPVVYYQFDRESFFGGEHISSAGYFEFERDGFGPVCGTVSDAMTAINLAVTGAEDRQYSERRRQAMPFWDGRCTQRVFDAICTLVGEVPSLADRSDRS